MFSQPWLLAEPQAASQTQDHPTRSRSSLSCLTLPAGIGNHYAGNRALTASQSVKTLGNRVVRCYIVTKMTSQFNCIGGDACIP